MKELDEKGLPSLFKLHPEVVKFLREQGTVIRPDIEKPEEYLFMPVWFKYDGHDEFLEVLTFDKLPDSLKDYIKKSREAGSDYMGDNPLTTDECDENI